MNQISNIDRIDFVVFEFYKIKKNQHEGSVFTRTSMFNMAELVYQAQRLACHVLFKGLQEWVQERSALKKINFRGSVNMLFLVIIWINV